VAASGATLLRCGRPLEDACLRRRAEVEDGVDLGVREQVGVRLGGVPLAVARVSVRVEVRDRVAAGRTSPGLVAALLAPLTAQPSEHGSVRLVQFDVDQGYAEIIVD
jgi:hypothetical protein